MIWILIGVLWLGAIIFLIIDKNSILKITELFVSIGISWIGSLGLYRYLIYYEPLLNLQYFFGYNITLVGEDGLLAYVNYCLILNFVPLLIFIFAIVASKIRPAISLTQLTKKFLLLELTYSWLIFNSVIVMFGLFTESFTNSYNALSIGSLVVGIAYLLLVVGFSIFLIKG